MGSSPRETSTLPIQLPPNPPGIRPLLDPEYNALRSLASDLPSAAHHYQVDGDPESRQIYNHCVTCRGRGEFLWRDPQTREPVTWRCDCIGQYLLTMYFRYAGIGLNYQRLHWDDMDGVEMKAQAVALDYIANAEGFVDRGLGLLFHGHQGTGKTLLVSLALKRLLANGFDGYFTTFQRLIGSFSAGWHDEVQRAWFTRRITNATILVIDDVGKEFKGERRQGDTVIRRPVEMVQSMFDEVVRSRVENCRPTLLTTNKTLTELERLYDNTGEDEVRVNPMSLFRESMLFQEFTGDNYRTSDGSAVKRAEEVRQGLIRPIRW